MTSDGRADLGLAGRVALVTGAAGGIGAAIVDLLAELGAVVVATDVSAEALARLAPGRSGAPIAADLSRYSLDMRPDGGYSISATGPEDHALAMEALRAMRPTPAPAAALSPTHLYAPPVVATMLGERIELFLTQFRQKKRAESNVADTTLSLRLLLGIVGDKPLASLCAEDMDRFLDAIAHWPANATKKAAYKGLAPAAVVAKAKKLGALGIAERLGLSGRHLNRRLAEEGSSFKLLRERVLHAMAEQLLQGPARLAEVAERLGFSDESAFAKAFRRWSGMTPGQFRQGAD